MKTLVDKTINLDKVERVLKEDLALDEDVKIEPSTKLVDLGVEPIDILNIYYKLGMNFSDYTSGEKLNEKGKKVLREIAELKRKEYDKDSDRVLHFEMLAQSNTTNEFIKQITVQDLIAIKNYEAIY